MADLPSFLSYGGDRPVPQIDISLEADPEALARDIGGIMAEKEARQKRIEEAEHRTFKRK